MGASFNTTVTSTVLNLNNSFLGDLDPISNHKHRVPMNQMRSPANQFQNNATNSFPTLNLMTPLQSNNGKRNGQESAIALSAQEINDFLN